MKQRSLAGPVVLIVIGGIFLLNNLRPDFSVWQAIRNWWPFLLIGFGAIQLAEVFLSASRGQVPANRGITTGQVALLVLVSLAIYSSTRRDRVFHIRNFQGSGMEIFGEQYDYPLHASGQADGVTMLVLDNLRGNMTVNGGEGTGYSAEGHKSIKAYNKGEADQIDGKTKLRFVREGNQLIVRTDQLSAMDGQSLSIDMEIQVPHGISVEARGRSGDLTMNSLTGLVDISSERGDIRLTDIGGNARVVVARSGLVRATGLKGNLDVEGRGSDVQLENISGQVSINGSYSGTLEFKNLAQPLHFESERTTLRIAQILGKFTMDLGDIRADHLVGPVKLKTRSRDVHIEDFTDAMDIEIEHGDIGLVPSKLPLARIDVKSRNGNVDLTLPENADFNLNASTRQGEATNDYGSAVRSEVEGRSASLHSVSARGPAININTERGTVSVKKS